MWDVLIVMGLVTAILGFQMALWRNAPQRHARYRLRAKLADLVHRGKLRDVRSVGTKGHIVAKH